LDKGGVESLKKTDRKIELPQEGVTSYQQASRILKDKKQHILNEWEMRLRAESPRTQVLEMPALTESIHIFLDQTIKAIEMGESGLPKLRLINKVFQRPVEQDAVAPDVLFDQVLVEYKILREVILQILQQEGVTQSEIREVISAAIQNGIIDVSFELLQISSIREKSAKEARISSLLLEQEMRKQFTSILSHDIRNPLTAAIMCAELLLRKHNNSELSSTLAHRIILSISRADKLLKDLLDVNKILAHQKLSLNFNQHDFRLILSQVLQDLNLRYGNQWKLTSPDSVLGHWSSVEMKRMLEIVLENSVKLAQPKSTVLVLLESLPNVILLRVRFLGEKLEPIQQLIISNPWDVDWSNSSEWIKLGVEMTLVRGIIENHGGSLSVESCVDNSTVFKIELPRDCRFL
jgi:signal transduction histidine kinase